MGQFVCIPSHRVHNLHTHGCVQSSMQSDSEDSVQVESWRKSSLKEEREPQWSSLWLKKKKLSKSLHEEQTVGFTSLQTSCLSWHLCSLQQPTEFWHFPLWQIQHADSLQRYAELPANKQSDSSNCEQLQCTAAFITTLYITHSLFPPINHIWTREQHGVSILPKDTSSCRLEEPGLEPPTARLADNLLNILSYSHQSLACCVLNASSPKNTVNTVKCSPVLNTSCTWQSMEKFIISIHLQK